MEELHKAAEENAFYDTNMEKLEEENNFTPEPVPDKEIEEQDELINLDKNTRERG